MKTSALPLHPIVGLLAAAVLVCSLQAAAQDAPDTPTQDMEAVSAAAQDYLAQQLSTLPGNSSILLDPIRVDHLAACDNLAPFLPANSKLRSRMTVGVRCTAPKNWVVYIQATLSVPGQYYVAASTIAPNQTIGPQDISPREGDLLALPTGTITDPNIAIGMTASYRIVAGQPIRGGALRNSQAVTRGQTVRVTGRGNGFVIAGEGQALENGAPGATIQVRMSSGQIVSGVVQNSGLVEIQL